MIKILLSFMILHVHWWDPWCQEDCISPCETNNYRLLGWHSLHDISSVSDEQSLGWPLHTSDIFPKCIKWLNGYLVNYIRIRDKIKATLVLSLSCLSSKWGWLVMVLLEQSLTPAISCMLPLITDSAGVFSWIHCIRSTVSGS